MTNLRTCGSSFVLGRSRCHVHTTCRTSLFYPFIDFSILLHWTREKERNKRRNGCFFLYSNTWKNYLSSPLTYHSAKVMNHLSFLLFLLHCSWPCAVIVQAFWRSCKFFLRTLSDFSPHSHISTCTWPFSQECSFFGLFVSPLNTDPWIPSIKVHQTQEMNQCYAYTEQTT